MLSMGRPLAACSARCGASDLSNNGSSSSSGYFKQGTQIWGRSFSLFTTSRTVNCSVVCTVREYPHVQSSYACVNCFLYCRRTMCSCRGYSTPAAFLQVGANAHTTVAEAVKSQIGMTTTLVFIDQKRSHVWLPTARQITATSY